MKKASWLLLALGGFLMGLAVMFPTVGFLAFFAMTPALFFLFLAVRDPARRYRRFFLYGFIYYYAYYLTIYHWFLDLYPMDFLGVGEGEAVILIAFCWFGLALLQTSLSMSVFPLFAFLSRRSVLRERKLLLPLLFAAQYTVCEWSQTIAWTGVPWGRLSLSQIDYGIISGSAALFGSYFITFILLLANGYLALGAIEVMGMERGERKRFFENVRVRIAAFCALGALLIGILCGTVGYLTAGEEKGEPVVVAAVQGNIGSTNKWSGGRERMYEKYERLTAKAAEAGAKIVVFPETFIPGTIYASNSLGKFVCRLASTYNVTIFCGGFHDADEGEQNAVFIAYPDGTLGEAVYAKRHLVPFGEYVPWRAFIETVFPLIEEINLLSYDLAPGEGSALFDTEYGKVGSLICFDSIYEELTRESVRDGAALMILPTNDSWFTDSRAIYMHHSQARLRAIESGRWIVRAADTGISSVISPSGESFEDQPPLLEGVAVYTAYAKTDRTLYSYIGNLLVWLLIAAILAVPAAELALYMKNKKKQSENN